MKRIRTGGILIAIIAPALLVSLMTTWLVLSQTGPLEPQRCPGLLSRTQSTNSTGSTTSIESGYALGLIVPMYMSAGCTWSELIQVKELYPTLTIVAVVNPHSGVGARNTTYASWVARLQAAGIVVLGYSDTLYESAPLAQVEANISDYANWYHVNGVFFDAMSTEPGGEGYYETLSRFARSLGLNYTEANPGTSTLSSYLTTVDNVMTYEGSSLPAAALVQNRSLGFAATRFSFTAYGVSDLPPQSYFDEVSHSASLVWVTDTDHRFQSLPSYILQEAEEVASA